VSWTLTVDAPVPLWRPASGAPGSVVAVTSRRGGISGAPFDTLNLGRSTADDPDAVTENRRRVLASLDVEHVATAGQVHGADVAVVREPGLHREVDALVTHVPRLALAVTAADCLPILFVSSGAVGAAHSGWRGTLAGVASATLRALGRVADAPPHAVHVYLGPCIGPCCYRVGDDVAARFPDAAVVRDDAGARVDLAAAVRLELVAAGVRPERITDPPACTSCNVEDCFSHRRDGGRTGRHWGVAALL
jgi:YfiH family protein